MLKWFRKYTKHLVKINYRSGNSEKFWTYFFNIKIDGSRRSAEWKSLSKAPLFLNIDDIESIWILKQKPGRKQYGE